jgi:Flp pilus assembly CpaE family ATPase
MNMVRLSGVHNNLSIPSDQIITEINSSNRNNNNADVVFETDERKPTRWAINLARRQQAARRAAYRKQNCEIYSETK